MNDMDWYKRMFQSNECLCGRTKHRAIAFCERCMKLVPEDIAEDLVKIGPDYPAAYEAAGRILDDEGLL
jgi:hypothetical protein